MDTQGLREAGSAAAMLREKLSALFAILHRAESRWFADPWQIPLVTCDEPCFSRRGDHLPVPCHRAIGGSECFVISVR
jgi:hypothetical protein